MSVTKKDVSANDKQWTLYCWSCFMIEPIALWVAQSFAGCVKSEAILLHPIILPKQWYLTWQECVLVDSCLPLTPTLGDHSLNSWTHTNSHIFFDPLPLSLSFSTRTFFHSLSPAHTHKGDWLHSCSVSEDTMAFSPALFYASGRVFVPMSEEDSLPKERDMRRKDSRKRGGRYKEVI